MEKKPLIVSIVVVVVAAGLAGYGLFSYHRTLKNLRSVAASQGADIQALKDEYAAKMAALDQKIAEFQDTSNTLATSLDTVKSDSSRVAATVGQVASTVGTLDKLSKTDHELLQQYSKVYFLNEHYVPVSLSQINPMYIYTPGKKLQIHSDVAPFLGNLLMDAKASGISLDVDSAYRSFGTQAQLKSAYKVTYGAGTANSFSAEQGYSEHQLGTAVDFTTVSLKGGLAGFDKTIEYQWLLNNAWRYGFVISYPANNPSYVFEPWHWRFVGRSLAAYIHNNNTYFYLMDQRVIDSYLANIFD